MSETQQAVETAPITDPEALPNDRVKSAPEAQVAAEPTTEDKQKAESEEKDKKHRNRTKEYIERQNRKIAELHAELEILRGKPAQDDAPLPEDYEFDTAKYTRALLQYELKQREVAENERKQSVERHQKTETYAQKAHEFSQSVPDFEDVVMSIPQEYLSQELQDAIMTHERGPEIAYHIAQNDDDLFALASIRPDMMAAAVERLAKRLTAPQPSVPAPKPITSAPRPPATVSGRSPTETPPEKLTDQQYADRERKRRLEARRR